MTAEAQAADAEQAKPKKKHKKDEDKKDKDKDKLSGKGYDKELKKLHGELVSAQITRLNFVNECTNSSAEAGATLSKPLEVRQSRPVVMLF